MDFYIGIVLRFEILTHITLKDIIIFSFYLNFLNMSILSQTHPVDRDFTIYAIYQFVERHNILYFTFFFVFGYETSLIWEVYLFERVVTNFCVCWLRLHSLKFTFFCIPNVFLIFCVSNEINLSMLARFNVCYLGLRFLSCWCRWLLTVIVGLYFLV